MKKVTNSPKKKLELKKLNIANLDSDALSLLKGGRVPQWWGVSMVGTIWSLPCDRNVSCGVYDV